MMVKLLKSAKLRFSIMMALAIVAVTGAAFASGEGTTASMDTITSTTVAQLTTVQQALLSLISQILPVALVVMGSVLVVTLGIRLFRRFTSA